MARRAHGDAGGEIQEDVAVDVLYQRTGPALRDERIVARV